MSAALVPSGTQNCDLWVERTLRTLVMRAGREGLLVVGWRVPNVVPG